MNNIDEPYVLIVDDDRDLRQVFSDLLKLRNRRSILVSNGAEALEQARDERPGLILLDLMMPIMDGHELLDKLTDDAELYDVPVIVITAHGQLIENLFPDNVRHVVTKSEMRLTEILSVAVDILDE